ncbi:MAG: hypothetical protein IH612_20935 [Desulfofustis sp.]|nr:hypothetical protein [Desulfofustis sp.]
MTKKSGGGRRGETVENDTIKLPADYNQVLFDYLGIYDPPAVVGLPDAALVKLYGLMIDALSGRRGAVMQYKYVPPVPPDTQT